VLCGFISENQSAESGISKWTYSPGSETFVISLDYFNCTVLLLSSLSQTVLLLFVIKYCSC